MQQVERDVILADPFVFAYLATMLQDLQNTEVDVAAEEDREQRDAGTPHELSDQLLRDCYADCVGFRAQPGIARALSDCANECGYKDEQAGSDFWLTRVGHGAGFWDRGLGAYGDVLTAACGHGTPYGNLDPVIGDDGLVYLE